MAQTDEIVCLLRVTDDETGMYEIDELDYSVPIRSVDWLDAREGRRAAVAQELRWLADRCESGERPFNPCPKETGDGE